MTSAGDEACVMIMIIRCTHITMTSVFTDTSGSRRREVSIVSFSSFCTNFVSWSLKRDTQIIQNGAKKINPMEVSLFEKSIHTQKNPKNYLTCSYKYIVHGWRSMIYLCTTLTTTMMIIMTTMTPTTANS